MPPHGAVRGRPLPEHGEDARAGVPRMRRERYRITSIRSGLRGKQKAAGVPAAFAILAFR